MDEIQQQSDAARESEKFYNIFNELFYGIPFKKVKARNMFRILDDSLKSCIEWSEILLDEHEKMRFEEFKELMHAYCVSRGPSVSFGGPRHDDKSFYAKFHANMNDDVGFERGVKEFIDLVKSLRGDKPHVSVTRRKDSKHCAQVMRSGVGNKIPLGSMNMATVFENMWGRRRIDPKIPRPRHSKRIQKSICLMTTYVRVFGSFVRNKLRRNLYMSKNIDSSTLDLLTGHAIPTSHQALMQRMNNRGVVAGLSGVRTVTQPLVKFFVGTKDLAEKLLKATSENSVYRPFVEELVRTTTAEADLLDKAQRTFISNYCKDSAYKITRAVSHVCKKESKGMYVGTD